MRVKDGRFSFMWSEDGWTGPDYAVAYAMADEGIVSCRQRRCPAPDQRIDFRLHAAKQKRGTNEIYRIFEGFDRALSGRRGCRVGSRVRPSAGRLDGF
jgi:hypothetical protein